jgi:hypothetical protein
MRKADKIKLSVIVGVSLLAFVVGCVDTAVQPIPTSINYNSDINVVNLTAGTGTATVSVYDAVVDKDSLAVNVLTTKIDYSSALLNGSSVAEGSTVPTSAYQTVPAGGKAIVVTYSNTSVPADTFKLTTDTDYKMRLYIVGDASTGGRSLVKSTERYIWQTPGSADGAALFPADSGWIRFFNGSVNAGSVSQVEIKGGSVDTTVAVALSFKGGSPYIQVPSGTAYTLFVTVGANVDSSQTVTPGSKGRYTTVVYGDTTAGVQVKVLTDD